MATTTVSDSSEPEATVDPRTIRKHTWAEFRESGMLWLVNRSLHLFGWAIVVSTEDTGETLGAFPARTEWRGLSPESDERGFRRVTSWISGAADALTDEVGR